MFFSSWKSSNWSSLRSYISSSMKRWIWTNLWKLERRPPQPTSALLNSNPQPTCGKARMLLFPGILHSESEKSNSKIIQKLKLPQKPKCTSKYPTSHSEKGSQWIMELEKRACIGYIFLYFSFRMDWILFHYFYSGLLMPQRLLVAFPAKLALQCCFQIFTEMRINFQVVSKLNSLYFKNHQNFVSGSAGNRPTLRLL